MPGGKEHRACEKKRKLETMHKVTSFFTKKRCQLKKIGHFHPDFDTTWI